MNTDSKNASCNGKCSRPKLATGTGTTIGCSRSLPCASSCRSGSSSSDSSGSCSGPDPVSDAQARCRACQVLLDLVGLGRLWTYAGPSRNAEALLALGGLPGQDQIALRAAFDLWNGWGLVGIGELLGSGASPGLIRAIGELLVAVVAGRSAIEEWSAVWCGRKVEVGL